MQIELKYRPSSTVALMRFDASDELTTEAGSMVAMSSHLQVETSTHKRGQGSLLKSLKRMFGGESFFLNHYKAPAAAELWLSTPLPGDMIVRELNNESLIVQAGSFLACESGVEIDVGWQGFKNLFSGESLFWLKLKGRGKIVLSTYGAVIEHDVREGFVVDTGHIVAFEEGLNFSLSKAGSSWISSFLGGEGIVCKFAGQGKLYCQSHSSPSFGQALTPHLKPIKG